MSERRVFKVGDVVIIRDWDDMVREFGEPDSDGDIKVVTSGELSRVTSTYAYTTWFVGDMRKFCGKIAVVDAGPMGTCREYNLRLFNSDPELDDIGDYSFTSAMLVPFDCANSKPDITIPFEDIFK